jgi:ethanolamine utilization microcompartment shell protein EutS
MVEFLLGVPGRLVALGTSLATGVSDILTAIGTRAPASTAVSNAVLTDVRVAYLDNLSAAPLRIKSIQRGVIDIFSGAGTATGTATITAVNPAKTELRLLGYHGYRIDTGGLWNEPASVQMASATSVLATRSTISDVISTSVSWELTEYY